MQQFFLYSLFQLLFLPFSPFHILSFTPNSPCGFQTATHEMRLCTNGSETQWRHLIRNTGGFTSLTSWGSETLRMSSRLRLVSKVLRKVQGKVENSSLQWERTCWTIAFHSFLTNNGKKLKKIGNSGGHRATGVGRGSQLSWRTVQPLVLLHYLGASSFAHVKISTMPINVII